MTTTPSANEVVASASPISPARPAALGIGLAALSGLLLVLAFPNVDQGWLAWIGLTPWLIAFPVKRLRVALGQGFVFGMAFYGGLLAWLAAFAAHAIGIKLGIVAWLIATTAQTSVMLVFAGGVHLLSRRFGQWQWFLGVPALWTLIEWIRQLGELGTGWGDLAYSQYRILPILQVTKLTGVWGLSFLIAGVATALAGLYRGKALGFKIFAPLVMAGSIYGFTVLHTVSTERKFPAAALQTNIDPNVSWHGWRAGDDAYVKRVMSGYSKQAVAAGNAGAKLVVWPETTFPGYLRADPDLALPITKIALGYREALVVGSNERIESSDTDANSMILVTEDGNIGTSYAKRQLVPFGEFVPGRKWMSFLNALHLTIYDRAAGADVQPLLDAGQPVGKIAVAICYESSYSRLTQEQVARGANIITIGSDDAWFGRTAAAAQHAAIASVRAAESDRYVIRAAPTGISRIIDCNGKILAEAPLFTDRLVLADVESRHTMPPFNRFGDWFVVLSGGIVLLSCALSGGRLRGSARSSDR